ncbi:phage portal protein [Streptomyces mirabilis]|uniref:phage portal protein n=1 Tax=Streptomyces mirabilis TaxID=68239 RepID=UPI0035DFF71D
MGRTLFGSLGRAAATFANKTPISFAPPGSGRRTGFAGGLTRPAGQTAQMRAQGSNSTLYAIVDRIITSYSQVEWHLYRTAKSGRDEDRVEVMTHAVLDLWNAPNKFMTGPMFRESGQQHEELTGEQWWVIARNPQFKQLPLELWPVRPDRMDPIPDAEDFIVGYVYRSPNGEMVPLDVEDVIFQRRPNPIDPYRGVGVVQTILVDLDATRASAEWNRAFFLNSAEPGGIVQVDKRLSDEEFNEFRDRWAEQHRGVSNAHRVGVLENGLQWVDRKYSMRDMQFTELRDVAREIIREAFGMPKPMLGAVDDVNRANAEAAGFVFAEWLIKPRLKRVKEILNTRLLPMYGRLGEGLEFDFDDPTPENREVDAAELTARTTAAALLVEKGFDPAATLSAVGLPEIAFSGIPTAVKAPAPTATWDDMVAGLVGGRDGIEAAMRWEAVAHIDDNTCQPCADNDGTTYKNRAAAYEDYPGGSGYVKCVGAEYGNKCRCKVVKRRKTGDDE